MSWGFVGANNTSNNAAVESADQLTSQPVHDQLATNFWGFYRLCDLYPRPPGCFPPVVWWGQQSEGVNFRRYLSVNSHTSAYGTLNKHEKKQKTPFSVGNGYSYAFLSSYHAYSWYDKPMYVNGIRVNNGLSFRLSRGALQPFLGHFPMFLPLSNIQRSVSVIAYYYWPALPEISSTTAGNALQLHNRPLKGEWLA